MLNNSSAVNVDIVLCLKWARIQIGYSMPPKIFNMKRKLEKLSCKHGSPMGRANHIPEDIETYLLTGKLHLVRLKWVDGDYDEGGAYWGNSGDYIYWAYGETATEQIDIFVRATDRNDAKLKLMMENFLISSTNFYH